MHIYIYREFVLELKCYREDIGDVTNTTKWRRRIMEVFSIVILISNNIILYHSLRILYISLTTHIYYNNDNMQYIPRQKNAVDCGVFVCKVCIKILIYIHIHTCIMQFFQHACSNHPLHGAVYMHDCCFSLHVYSMLSALRGVGRSSLK